MQYNPASNPLIEDSMRFASSKLLKIVVPLAVKPNARALMKTSLRLDSGAAKAGGG
jgi:hypothetical protein